MVVFSIHFHIFNSLANLWFLRFPGQLPTLMTSCCLDHYPLIRSARRHLAEGESLFRYSVSSLLSTMFPSNLFYCFLSTLCSLILLISITFFGVWAMSLQTSHSNDHLLLSLLESLFPGSVDPSDN